MSDALPTTCVQVVPKAENVFDALGQALARGQLMNLYKASEASNAMRDLTSKDRYNKEVHPCGGGNSSELTAFPSSAVRKLQIMVLRAFSKLGRRHEICDKLLDILIADVFSIQTATASSSQSAYQNDGQKVGRFRMESNNTDHVFLTDSPTDGPLHLTASIAMAVVNLKAFDRQDAFRAIASNHLVHLQSYIKIWQMPIS